MPHDKIHEQAFAAEAIAHRAKHDPLARHLAYDLLQRGGEIFQNENRDGAGVLQLVLEFARRVQRIDVDHRQAGAQDASQHNRVLQHVGHHDCYPLALDQSLRLQPGADRRRLFIEIAERQRGAHARIRRRRAVLPKCFLQQLHQRLVLRDVDLGRHARWIAFQPESITGAHDCRLLLFFAVLRTCAKRPADSPLPINTNRKSHRAEYSGCSHPGAHSSSKMLITHSTLTGPCPIAKVCHLSGLQHQAATIADRDADR